MNTDSKQPHSNRQEVQEHLENNLMIDTLAGRATEGPPVWLMRQAGRYLPEYQEIRAKFPDFMSLCRNTDATTEVALQPLRRFNLDAAIVFSDILTIADSLDLGLNFVKGSGPILSHPISSPKDITNLPFSEAIERLEYVYDAVKSLRSALGKRLPIIGFSGSPWTQSCYMISGRSEALFHTAKRFAYTHPVATTALINELSSITAQYLLKQYQAGADILFVIDTWGGILSDTQFQSYSANALSDICASLKRMKCPAPVMFFSKGLTEKRIKMLKNITNLRCIGVDWTANIESLQACFPDLVFQGNLDPSILHAGPIATQQHTHYMLNKVNKNTHYIAGLGHGVLPETPIESVHAFVDQVRHYNIKDNNSN